jgi:hypothetical protein
VATAWIALFLAQTSFIALHRISLHRRVGMVGALVAAAMFVIGVLTAVDSLRRGVGPFGLDARIWFLFPLSGIVLFAALVTTALILRRRRETHKRLMLLATLSLLNPAVGRLTAPFATDIPSFMALAAGLTNALIVIVILRDLWTGQRVHPAVIWGGVPVVALPFVLMLGNSPIWLAFADALR